MTGAGVCKAQLSKKRWRIGDPLQRNRYPTGKTWPGMVKELSR